MIARVGPDVMAEPPEAAGTRSAKTLWSSPRDHARKAEEYREAATFCLEFTFCDGFGPGGVRPEFAGDQAAHLKGRGAPARRIIGLGGNWGWPWSFPLRVREQAARYMKLAALSRKREAACDRARRKLRRLRSRPW